MKSANYKFLMGRRLWALMALILIIAQTTRGEIIPQSRRTTWQAGVVGGILPLGGSTTIDVRLPECFKVRNTAL